MGALKLMTHKKAFHFQNPQFDFFGLVGWNWKRKKKHGNMLCVCIIC